ncbi:MAG TPA: glycosyltransferase [Baekduia sp.]|uniref:glycosyltransferase n=1 Tax=Baekduia sp. TaxID=2600305 RepID=UPI002C80B4C3|nr:glycosyltransferase [Baekduia sp.]HMJ33999.1 glycosyltransferase [Baekduia sp.]
MVLVTIGTNEQPFDRLVAAAAALRINEKLVVQYGSSAITSGAGEWLDFLGFDELADRMRAARVVVCHAGVGSIMLARRCGRRPVVVPRRLHLGEAVDDHQLPLARRLAASGLVTLVENETGLADAIADHADGAPATTGGGLPGVAALVTELRSGLDRAGVARAGAV